MNWHWPHDYEAVAVTNLVQEPDFGIGDLKNGIGVHWTQILWRCACGKVKSERIRGVWTLEQIQGQNK